jgi:hypothetical protein
MGLQWRVSDSIKVVVDGASDRLWCVQSAFHHRWLIAVIKSVDWSVADGD